MVARPGHRGASLAEGGVDALAEAALALGSAGTLAEALQAVADGAARATGAEVVIARVADDGRRRLNACAVAATSTAVAAELAGSHCPLNELPDHEESDLDRLPPSLRRAAERVRAPFVVVLPVHVEGEVRGSLELMRPRLPFDESERQLARLAAAQAALAIRAFAPDVATGRAGADAALLLVGEALAAGGDELRTAEQVTRLAVEATGASAGVLWRVEPDGQLEPVGTAGVTSHDTQLDTARAAAQRALTSRHAVFVEAATATMQLGQPPVGALQLLFAAGATPSADDLATLATFGVRAAHSLRVGTQTRAVGLELERTRALLAVVGQAISQLSLAHTLETAVERVAELLDADRLAVYLREDGRLYAAAGIGLAGPHVRVAERLLDLALGPFRSRGILALDDVASDPRVAAVGDAAAEAGIEAAIAVPLLAHNDVIGLLGVFPARGHRLTENDDALVTALAAQLAVAVQNAQLHERAKRLGDERERALDAERSASKQVRALYEISRSFAQSLSLDATLEAVTSTVVDVLDVDVALIHMPDDRRELLVPRAINVAQPQLEDPVRAILYRAEPFGARPVQRLFRRREPYRITADSTKALVPFIERGWTAAVVPIATPAEVLAALTVVSTRPGTPVTPETIEQATGIAGQAALAIDNARLYQQQKQFADTMQRSLLPRSAPELDRLELGAAYESSARVEVGGDVYDFMTLGDGRLAVALGDVTGHGIEAAADMAMAKFVFRSLAREHPEPSDFLQSANDVVVDEIAPGKFITMIYLLIDEESGAVAAAGAGHPPPRLLHADGTVTALDAGGLVLGVERGQRYETVRAQLEAGGAVVLYTDGVVEARRDGELYGDGRLDSALSRNRVLPAAELARAVLDDCRAYARGDLVDDCAVVVVKRSE
jgi:serine phosphatase RsbU (regulator of sigma subunit)